AAAMGVPVVVAMTVMVKVSVMRGRAFVWVSGRGGGVRSLSWPWCGVRRGVAVDGNRGEAGRLGDFCPGEGAPVAHGGNPVEMRVRGRPEGYWSLGIDDCAAVRSGRGGSSHGEGLRCGDRGGTGGDAVRSRAAGAGGTSVVAGGVVQHTGLRHRRLLPGFAAE